ncbi:hypothetical protein GM3708_2133 [Geminocystis sp. NIES-3708]|nr:hypothetical protein GM3708_2133 [Geminocystis sp. NIES-3708]
MPFLLRSKWVKLINALYFCQSFGNNARGLNPLLTIASIQLILYEYLIKG